MPLQISKNVAIWLTMTLISDLPNPRYCSILNLQQM